MVCHALSFQRIPGPITPQSRKSLRVVFDAGRCFASTVVSRGFEFRMFANSRGRESRNGRGSLHVQNPPNKVANGFAAAFVSFHPQGDFGKVVLSNSNVVMIYPNGAVACGGAMMLVSWSIVPLLT